MVNHTICPICSGVLKPFLQCTDHLVTRETFPLLICQSCELVLTNSRPNDEQLYKYYESQDYISHTSSATNLTNIIYLLARQFTLRNKLRLINSLNPKENSLLDFGAGTGHFLQYINSNDWHGVGIEPNQQATSNANPHTKIYADLNALPDNPFTIITLWHVLEHVPDPVETINQLKARLTPEGRMIVAVPNYESFDAHYYKSTWAGYDVPRHLWHFNKQALQTLLMKNNLRIHSIKPMPLDSFYVSLLSEKNIKNNILAYPRAIVQGLRSNIKAKSNMNYSSLIYIIKK